MLCDLVNQFFPFAQTPAVHCKWTGIGDSSAYSFVENIQFFLSFLSESLLIPDDLLFDANDLYALDTLAEPTSASVKRNILLAISLFAGYVDALSDAHASAVSSVANDSTTTTTMSSTSDSATTAPRPTTTATLTIARWDKHRGSFAVAPGDALMFAISAGGDTATKAMLKRQHTDAAAAAHSLSLALTTSHGWTPVYTGS